jgi:hypothetical protein
MSGHFSPAATIPAASPEDRGPEVFGATTTILAVATVFVVARLFTRIKIVRHVTADDYLILVAWLIAFFLSFSINYGTKKGLGRHDADIPYEHRPDLTKSEYAFSVLYVCFRLLKSLLMYP